MEGEVQNSCTFVEPPHGAVVIEADPVQLPRRIRRSLDSFILPFMQQYMGLDTRNSKRDVN